MKIITLKIDVVAKLSPRGIIAYVAYQLNRGKAANTAKFAALVKVPESVMEDGLKNLWAHLPEVQNLDQKESKPKKPFEFPDWVDREQFAAYLRMRQKIGKPLAEDAYHLAVGKLSKLKAEGHDPNDVLEQSIFNSWQGLFPIKIDIITGNKPPAKLRETEFKL